MYQFYYADHSKTMRRPHYQLKIQDIFRVKAIRPAMWEEHCLECSAPLCFDTCPHYEPRKDGRCKRFTNGIRVYPSPDGISGQGARVVFRQWANMMTVLFPIMMSVEKNKIMTAKNQRLGKILYRINNSFLPLPIRWNGIRGIEYIRRRSLRKLEGASNIPDAFIFHGYSFEKEAFHLILEIYHEEKPVFKTSLYLEPGENLIILDKEKLSEACYESNNLVKIYPENNMEAELDILWCDFVQGERVQLSQSAEKVKCLVWDLDNTLWKGTLIETDDTGTLQLNPKVSDTIMELDRRGIIQSIASKNDFEQAWPLLEKLGLAEYFLYPQIHWNSKSSSMIQIAKDLNIGIDSLALIDDSVFERNQVKSECTSVRVYDIAELPQLLTYTEFDVPVTEVSKNRRSMYRAEEKRMQIQKNENGDILTFLKKCHIEVECFIPTSEDEILRCYELIARTNQLNLSGIKYTEEEFHNVLIKTGVKNVAISCQDDFGSYGIVGYIQYKVKGNQLIFSEYAMSCRVAGKYIESALFTFLLHKENCESGIFNIQKTKKNGLLLRTLEQIGFQKMYESEGEVEYTFDDNLEESAIVHVVERTDSRQSSAEKTIDQ